MKKIVLIFSYFMSLSIFAQTESFEIKKYPSRLRLSIEEIDMNGEPDMGFIGHGYEIFGLASTIPKAYFGVNSYSTITGIRSGFFVFGVSSGYQSQLLIPKLNYDLGFFIGGGGGSGAPDGGGLMLRPHLDLSYNLTSKIAIRTGVTYVNFPTGAINSFNLNLGLTLNTNTFIADKVNFNPVKQESSKFNNIEVNLLSSNLFNFSKGPLKNNHLAEGVKVNTISLIGAILKTKQNHNFYGIVKLGGAFIGEVDGFMMLLPGIGYQIPITNWLNINTQALIGGAGGGNVQFGGGLATQLDIGTGIKLGNYLFNINYGKTYAPNGNYASDHLDISFGKSFDIYSNPNHDKTIVNDEKLKLEEFNFSLSNRTYFLPNANGKLGKSYQDYFSLINFELEKRLKSKLSILLTTNWAYLGDYGAYAEGWIGMQYNIFKKPKKLNFNIKTLFGAGGGGGIDLGSGMAYQYGVGTEISINKRWNMIMNTGQVRPVLDGNFTPIFFDIGVKLNLNQLIKK